MIHEIRLSGSANDKVDYVVTIMGRDINSRYCYDAGPDGDRFFSPHNEFTITANGIEYSGTGGSLCEYMFGIDLPLKDLLRKDVCNRLVMYGAFTDANDHITFTNNTAGAATFEHLFMSGNAVSNYHFFVQFSRKAAIRHQQRDILKAIGKQAKRSAMVGNRDDAALCREIYDSLGDPGGIIFLFRLVNRHNEEYFNAFNAFYAEQKTLLDRSHEILDELARRYNIPLFQQERIKIDGTYRLPENKKIVDEYKDILISVVEKKEINPSELAKLSRLRTLSLRLNIQHNLFDTLDELLLKDMKIVEVEEPEYVSETRAIFEGLFFKSDRIKGHVSSEDLVKILNAKQKSTAVRDQAFEGLLLDTVRACDEHARDSNDMSAIETMSGILTYFDRFDSTANMINNLAFMENASINEDGIRSIVGNKDVFDGIDPDIFDRLFIAPIRENAYLTRYGRKKLESLATGLAQLKSGDTTYRDLAAKIAAINGDDMLYTTIHRYIKDRFKSFYAELNSREDQEIFIQDLNREIQTRGIVQRAVPHAVFEEIILDIRKESFYLNNLLPHVVLSRDSKVREDFLNNSGLDRFYVEELENEYFALNEIDPHLLEAIRK